MTNLLERALNCNDAKIIQDTLGIESDDVVNYYFRRPDQPIASSAQPPRRMVADESALSGLSAGLVLRP